MIYPRPSRKMLRLPQNISQPFHSASHPGHHNIISIYRSVLNYICICYTTEGLHIQRNQLCMFAKRLTCAGTERLQPPFFKHVLVQCQLCVGI
jgi:hypothetical protein